MNLLDIGAEIRQRRIGLNLTQADLATKARVARSTVNALENGQLLELGTGRLLHLLEALGLTLNIVPAVSAQWPTLDDRYAEQTIQAQASAPRPRYRG